MYFCLSEVYCPDNGEMETQKFPGHIYVRQSDDYRIPGRKVQIVKTKYLNSPMPWISPPLAAQPKILDSKLESTRHLITDYYRDQPEKKKEALKYYECPTKPKENPRVISFISSFL